MMRVSTALIPRDFFILGKMKIAKIIEAKPEVRNLAKNFLAANADVNAIVPSGETIIKLLYNASNSDQDLDAFRFEQFIKCIAESRTQLANLPPTRAAAKMHSFRVYFQIQSWLGRNLDPLKWGWQKTETGGFIPIDTTISAAPPQVLKLISCKCARNCGPACGCRRAGLSCSVVCRNCHGMSCLNPSVVNTSISSSSDEDSDQFDDPLFL